MLIQGEERRSRGEARRATSAREAVVAEESVGWRERRKREVIKRFPVFLVTPSLSITSRFTISSKDPSIKDVHAWDAPTLCTRRAGEEGEEEGRMAVEVTGYTEKITLV